MEKLTGPQHVSPLLFTEMCAATKKLWNQRILDICSQLSSISMFLPISCRDWASFEPTQLSAGLVLLVFCPTLNVITHVKTSLRRTTKTFSSTNSMAQPNPFFNEKEQTWSRRVELQLKEAHDQPQAKLLWPLMKINKQSWFHIIDCLKQFLKPTEDSSPKPQKIKSLCHAHTLKTDYLSKLTFLELCTSHFMPHTFPRLSSSGNPTDFIHFDNLDHKRPVHCLAQPLSAERLKVWSVSS